MRNKYLSRLVHEGVWQTKPQSGVKGSSKSTFLTIFDWDDTLFPTSAFSPKTQEEMETIARLNQELFLQIDDIVENLLKKASEGHSKVIIVTNAHNSWVDYSSQMLMPKTAKLLKEQIKVISARLEPREG